VVLAAVTAVIAASFLSRAAQEAKLATRSGFLNSAFNLAEAGIEEGLYALNTNGFSSGNGWTLATSATADYVKTITSGFNFGQATGAIYVRVDSISGAAPAIYAAGVINFPNQPRLIKQLRVGIGRRRPWSNGMVSKNNVSFSVASSVDSYDSALGPYNAATNRADRATIATNSADPAEISLTGASSIYGYVATGGSDPSAALGRIYGATSPAVPAAPAAYIDPSRVRKDFNTNLPDVAAPSGTAYSLGAYSATFATKELPRVGDLPGPNGRYLYTATSLSVMAGTLNIKGPVDLIVTGNTTIVLLGKIDVGPSGSTNPSFNLYTPGNVTIALLTPGIVNSTGAAQKATIWGTAPASTPQTIDLLGAAALTGTIYAPNGRVNMAIAADVYGAVIANEINVSVWGRFHWDSQLATVESSNFGYRVNAWSELTAAPGSGNAFARDNREPFNTLF
jgi:hypothetical protein